MENKPARLLFVPLGKAHNKIALSQSGREVAVATPKRALTAFSRDKRINILLNTKQPPMDTLEL